jgi:RNA polymerase sigma-70 factor (ECF subfamily)
MGPAAASYQVETASRREVPVQHDTDELAAWLDRHGAALVLLARQWVGSHADAEDVLQQALVGFWRSRGRVDDPVAYLYGCVRREARAWLRGRRRRSRREQIAAADGEPRPEPAWCCGLEAEEEAQRIQVAMARLPAEQREVLVLHIWGGLTFAQIGAAVDISPNTAASRYRYALGSLRGELAEGDR